MAFSIKNWKNGSVGATALSAEALKDTEERLSAYTDLSVSTGGLQPVAEVSSGATLVVGKFIPVNATSGAITMALPTGKSLGTVLGVEKIDATSHVVNVEGNIRGTSSAKVELVLLHETVLLVADSSGHWWPTASHKTLSSLKSTFQTTEQMTNNGMGTCTHGSTAGTARPSGFKQITWFGSVAPTNMIENDIWIQTV